MDDYPNLEISFDGLKAATPEPGHSFFDEAVEQLIEEPDPTKREILLERIEPRTRSNVEAAYAQRVKEALTALEADSNR